MCKEKGNIFSLSNFNDCENQPFVIEEEGAKSIQHDKVVVQYFFEYSVCSSESIFVGPDGNCSNELFQ